MELVQLFSCLAVFTLKISFKNLIFNSLHVSLSQISKLSRRPLSSFSLTSSSLLLLINLWVSTGAGLTHFITESNPSQKKKETLFTWRRTTSCPHRVRSVLDGQASFPQDERGEFLRALHGGAGHSAWQTSVRDGHRRVCQTTQKVGPLRFPPKRRNTRWYNFVDTSWHFPLCRATLRKLRAENMFETWVSQSVSLCHST